MKSFFIIKKNIERRNKGPLERERQERERERNGVQEVGIGSTTHTQNVVGHHVSLLAHRPCD